MDSSRREFTVRPEDAESAQCVFTVADHLGQAGIGVGVRHMTSSYLEEDVINDVGVSQLGKDVDVVLAHVVAVVGVAFELIVYSDEFKRWMGQHGIAKSD